MSDTDEIDFDAINQIRPERRARLRAGTALIGFGAFMVWGAIGYPTAAVPFVAVSLPLVFLTVRFLRLGVFRDGDHVVVRGWLRTRRRPLDWLAGAGIHYRDLQEHHLDVVGLDDSVIHCYTIKSHFRHTSYLEQARDVINGWAIGHRMSTVWLAVALCVLSMTGCGDDDPAEQAGPSSTGVTQTTHEAPVEAVEDAEPVDETAEPVVSVHVAVDGDDIEGDGSTERPFASILHAIDRVPDGGEVVVGAGTFDQQLEIERRFDTGIVLRAAEPYRTRLRNDGIVIACHICAGITFEGFDIAHAGSDQVDDLYVIQIQDARNDGVGGHRITFRNNVIHDSRNNDLIKVNNGADDVLIENNVFYNQQGPDSHIDANSATNVAIRNNIFFNDQPDPEAPHRLVCGDQRQQRERRRSSRGPRHHR